MRAKVRRNVVVVTMAVLVCAAVALNWRFTQNQAAEGAAEETGTKILGEAKLVSGGEGSEEETAALDEDTVYTGSDYFASARLTRQQARDNAISLLQPLRKTPARRWPMRPRRGSRSLRDIR